MRIFEGHKNLHCMYHHLHMGLYCNHYLLLFDNLCQCKEKDMCKGNLFQTPDRFLHLGKENLNMDWRLFDSCFQNKNSGINKGKYFRCQLIDMYHHSSMDLVSKHYYKFDNWIQNKIGNIDINSRSLLIDRFLHFDMGYYNIDCK